jgi:peptide/nickel transport system substrate-binding protein
MKYQKLAGFVCVVMLFCFIISCAEALGASPKTQLVIAMDEDINGLDPFTQNETINNVYTTLIYDPLLKADYWAKTINPGLAESYEIVSNMEYIFKLRPNVKFHNGAILKASDVKFSIERAAASAGMAPKVAQISEVQVIDDLTVRILLNTPSTTILNVLTFCGTSILNEEFVKAHPDRYAHNGTGPYVFREWISGESVTLDRFDDYWGPKGGMPTLKFVCMPEAASRTIALETGDIDINSTIAAIDIPKVEANSNLAVYDNVSGKVDYLGMNLTLDCFKDKNVRLAIAHAIDKQEIINVLLEGRGVPMASLIGKGQDNHDDSIKGYPFDLKKAKELMDASSFSKGFEMKFYVRREDQNTVAQVLQAQLAEIGVTIKIERIETAIQLNLAKNAELDMFMGSWQPATTDADNPLRSLLTSSRAGTTNMVWLKNTEYDAWIDSAITLLDPVEKQAAYTRIQQYIADDCPAIPIFSEMWTCAAQKQVKGIKVPPAGETLPYHLFYWEEN